MSKENGENKGRKEALEKVRKLLALSKSNNENEAAIAAQKAKSILLKYDLSMTDIEITEEKVIDHIIETNSKVFHEWKAVLSQDVAKYMYCDSYYSRHRIDGVTITFIGTKVDTTVAEYTFRYLVREIESLSEKKRQELPKFYKSGHVRRYLNSYRVGLVMGLSNLLKRQEKTETKTSSERDLMIIDNKKLKVQEEMKRRKIRLVASNSNVNLGAFLEGKTDSSNINLRKGIEKANSKGIENWK